MWSRTRREGKHSPRRHSPAVNFLQALPLPGVYHWSGLEFRDAAKEDLEARGPIKVSEAEAAQKVILTTARKLAEAGTLSLGAKGESYV